MSLPVTSTDAAQIQHLAQQPGMNRAKQNQLDRPPGDDLREAFTSFVGESFYGQLIAAMRKTVSEPAYLHGGRAEQVFQGQLDQVLSQYMTDASADTIADPMFELFMLRKQ